MLITQPTNFIPKGNERGNLKYWALRPMMHDPLWSSMAKKEMGERTPPDMSGYSNVGQGPSPYTEMLKRFGTTSEGY